MVFSEMIKCSPIDYGDGCALWIHWIQINNNKCQRVKALIHIRNSSAKFFSS